MGTYDALLDIVYAGQAALDRDSELALIQVDFSAAFDHVNRSGLLVKLQDYGVGGQDLSVIRCFLSDRALSAKVDGKRSRPVDVISGVPQGSVFGPLLFPLLFPVYLVLLHR